MGKIWKKRRVRTSKADLSRRSTTGVHRDPPQPKLKSDVRHRLRRRNVTSLNHFYDNYDDDEDCENEKRKKKKLKLVLKLTHGKAGYGGVDSLSSSSSPSRTRPAEVNVAHASAPESHASAVPALSGSSLEYGDGNKPYKKRRIEGEDCGGGDVRSIGIIDQNKESGKNGYSKEMESVLDKISLELILDRLQKKDTYGVYAEPVDPEEIPDYHDVIEHPMDFGTIRKKLAEGAYSNLEQFKNDVFLICTNAMQYNAPETIYFKQAHSIQELARKKFQRLQINIECTETELKSEQKIKSNSVKEKPTQNSSSRIVQEPHGSDLSSGATLANAGGTCTWSNTTQANGCERPSNVDGPVDGNSSLADNKQENADEKLSGKGFPSKSGNKSFVPDENRRGSYTISNQPVVRAESIFTTFEDENKQLDAVGLNVDHSYARSLARFAATLGSVAWKVASRRIEQALPIEFKFGRGWVGEYEPLATPVVMLENHIQKQQAYAKNLWRAADPVKYDKLKAVQHDYKLDLRNLNSLGMEASSKTTDPAKERSISGIFVEGKPCSYVVAGTNAIISSMYQQQNPLTMNCAKSDNNVLNQVELNHSSSVNGNPVNVALRKQLEKSPEMTTTRLQEMVLRDRNLVHSVPIKQLQTDEVVAGRVPNGKTVSSSSNGNRVNTSSSDFNSNQQGRSVTYFPYGSWEQGLSDPVQLMRMFAERMQNQQKSSNHSTVDTPLVMPSGPLLRSDGSRSADTAAARAWMSIGAVGFKPMASCGPPKMQTAAAAASLYDPVRELPSPISRFREEPPVAGGLLLQSENKLPTQAFLPHPFRIGDKAHTQTNRSIAIPQLETSNLSRYQEQSPWRGPSSHTQPTRNQDMLPPDLNISYQSSGLDSQQPDLALQL